MPKSGTHRRVLYDAIAAVWPGGLTEGEACRITGLEPNTIRPRRRELVEDDRVRQSEVTRENDRGNDEFAFVLTVLGCTEHGIMVAPLLDFG